MRPLQLMDLLDLLADGASEIALGVPETEDAARAAAEAWPACRLPGAAPNLPEYVARTARNGKALCHFEAGAKNCYLIVVLDASGNPEGYLPFDIGGQYRPVTLIDLATGFEGEPTEAVLADVLSRLGEGGTPAAILENGAGSYLQTYRNGPDDYDLEHQFVTTAFHFEAKGPLKEADVLRAFRSYAFGKYEWAREFVWIPQPLSEGHS